MKLVLGSLFILIAIEAYLAPFTKVEESFNLQATHDLLHRVDRYDHLDFPGVVPRTFVGAVLLSVCTWPWLQLFPSLSLLDQQVLVRLVLAAFVVFSLGQFASGVRAVFGSTTATFTIALLLCQFHLVFWSSRTLPNTLALPWVELGLSHWISSLSETSRRTYHLKWMIRYLTFAGIVFRFEAGILLVVLLGFEYAYKTMAIMAMVKPMIITAIFSLAFSVPLDSYLWGTWLWPEGMVFYFNGILNKSAAWGTLPFYAYFISFLPRLLLISYPLAMVAFVRDVRVRRLLMPMLVYILIFSCLPHKEWRFIMYTIPVFTASSAVTVHSVVTAARRSRFYKGMLLILLGGTVVSFIISILMFQVSRLNYPGGEALLRLHTIEKNEGHVSVHIDVEAAMTGVSLYGQTNKHWVYSKNESHQTQQDMIEARYTHLITAHPDRFDSKFKVLDVIYGLDKVTFVPLTSVLQFNMSPIQFRQTPKLYLLKLTQPHKVWVQSTVGQYPVVLYSKTYCPYCRAAKQLISKYCQDIKVIEVDLERDGHEIKQALYQLTGRATFPNLFKQGQSLGGYDRLSELDSQGQLTNLCQA
ncbi:Alg9-like mannosyltransferase family-domain-containing protein [Gilbertella persicaria]|uniref:Alg9-like mannosyltransferase family-domain-containing protein n=1 Tax=Gilbertella persicaria TaxID=101096 RepID=UPI002221186F|nr:Alg9-like mannosyltransferase family-domain-containing protein [Gilbertella persicaria]KAI8059375.1 Alg9-like mannosyltransferase family-domain-containing protein [Gilbertella persicaria]